MSLLDTLDSKISTYCEGFEDMIFGSFIHNGNVHHKIIILIISIISTTKSTLTNYWGSVQRVENWKLNSSIFISVRAMGINE